MIITIDGPSGAGKTTVGRMLAGRLGFRYVDTGALYRAAAWWMRHRGLDPLDESDIERACRDLQLEVDWDADGVMHVRCGSEDITRWIRTEAIGMLASRISAHRMVRETLWRIQRRIGALGDLVFEGRDMGSQVFPDADHKFFLTATLDERARRRFMEIRSDAVQDTLETVRQKMTLRDHQDRNRSIAPLTVPDGAVEIDSTGRSPEEIVDRMIAHIQRAG